ncbi:two-component hybrid sensor and regulator [Dictyobacter sp. S3.2.2.5]|uniref:histidine kinase n=1 Tax=Dictyobacter halimunensis TaxID=3026934 RepID=A0ABQ6FYI0_9CHLR|nr:two-component hybrid sensor and regulator [Dictyobacter sp. S3.2.2.5]
MDLKTPHKHPLASGGEMGLLIREYNWAQTPLGPPSHWPQSLQIAVSMMLEARFPMAVAWGDDFTLLYNDSYRPILGATKHPALGKKTAEIFAESWQEIIGPLFEKAMAGVSVGYTDFLIPLDRNGYLEECYFEFSYSHIQDESGEVGGILIAATETTKRVVGERRLKMLQTLAASMVEIQTPEQVCQLAASAISENRAGIPFALLYLLSSDGTQAQLAGNAQLAVGTVASPESIQVADTQAPWPLRSVASSGKPQLVKIFPPEVAAAISALDSETHPAPQTALILPMSHAGSKELSGFLVVGINPRRKLDDDYRAFLQLAAGQIAAGLASARAYQESEARARALAELDQAKTVFFHNISHEFRTPLTLTLGPLEALLDDRSDPLSQPQRAQLELARRNAMRQLKLVNALLDFARIKAGRSEAVYEPTDLPQFTTDLASTFRDLIEKAGLQLIVECPPMAEQIAVDRQMWEKIVLNLLSNAFKFTFTGSIRVALHAAGDEVELIVQDTGVGVSEHDLPHIFERFYRALPARTRTQEGAGIGLSLVQELVHLHGGTITIQSQEGVGTTFTIRVPRRSGQASTPQKERPQRPSPEIQAPPYVAEAMHWLAETQQKNAAHIDEMEAFPISSHYSEPLQSELDAHPGHVLVVDDNADMRAYLQRLLSPTYQVELAADGSQALTIAREQHPDLIISDIVQPELDGFALLKELRADQATADIAVMLLSARTGEETIVEGLGLGAEDYLVKPFSARELMARVALRMDMARLHKRTRQTRAHLYELLMQAPAHICVLQGPEHIYALANPLYMQLLGQRPILGKSVREVLPEIEGQGYFEMLDQVYQTGKAISGIEARLELQNNTTGQFEEHFFNFVYQPLTSASGEVEGILVHAVEVTEEVWARRQLTTSEARFRFLAEEMPQKVFMADPNGGVNYFNPQWTAFTGLPFEEIRDWGWTRFVHPEDVEENVSRWRHSIETGEPFYCEHRFRRADGVYRWHMSQAIPIRDNKGNITQWIGTNTDIEDQKQLEGRKDEFLHMVSHDLRSPLAAMKGNLQFSQRKLSRLRPLVADVHEAIPKTLDEVSELIVRALRQIDIQNRLIGDLLDISRIQSGQLNLDLKLCDLVPLVQEIALDHQAATPGRTITLDLPDAEEPLMVLADADRIGQVVSNYLTNALKYSAASAPVTVGVRQSGNTARVWVRDRGPGLSPQQKQRIWERFYKAPGIAITTGAGHGIGLGLYICQTLVQRHNGEVGVESIQGQGSTFWFTIPLLDGTP